MASMPISPVARGGPRETAYAEFVAQDRPLLLATSFLLTGDLDRAEQLVRYALAAVFEHWTPQRPRIQALQALLRAERRNAHLPATPGQRFELLDDDGVVAAGTPLIIADLRLLPPAQRAVIVLERFVELPVTQIAYAVERPIDEVLALSQQARAVLLSGHPSRGPDAELARELVAAVPASVGSPVVVADDIDRGGRLRRRHRLVRAAAALVAAVLLVVGAVQLFPRSTPVAVEPPVTTPTSPSADPSACNPSRPTCRGRLLIAWRSEMAEATESHLDPTGRYFSAFGYSYDTRSDTPGIWDPGADGGALAFQLFRPDGGATEIYVQIATSRRYAVECGKTTGRTCISQRFMDGNRFILTTTATVKQGMEVQYSPEGTEVITAIARNTRPGLTLSLTNSQLMELVQDPRLRLPPR